MAITHYKIKSPQNTFYARVENRNPMYDRIYMGARRKCLILTIYKDGSEPPNLDGYTHDDTCNYEHKMERGTAHLLKVGIAFMHALYPTTRQQPILFKDTSTIRCNHGYKLSLPHYYAVYYGKTWYEAKLGAVPEHPKKWCDAMEQLRLHLTTPLPALFQFAKELTIPKTHMPHIKPIWERSKTFKELFASLKSLDCIVFQGWLERWLHQILPTWPHQWQIPPSQALPKIHIKVTHNIPEDLFTVQEGGAVAMEPMQFRKTFTKKSKN